jgi:hypothetical protein
MRNAATKQTLFMMLLHQAVLLLLAVFAGLLLWRVVSPTRAAGVVEQRESLEGPQRTRHALAARLAERHGLSVEDPQRDVLLLRAGRWDVPTSLLSFDHYIGLARAVDAEGHTDVFRLDAGVAPNGEPVRFGFLRNLLNTPEVDERLLAAGGARVAFAQYESGRYDSVVLLDFAGEPAELTADWTSTGILLDRLSNYQRFGQRAGIGRTTFLFRFPPDQLDLSVDGSGRVVAVVGGGRETIVMDPALADEAQPDSISVRRAMKVEQEHVHVIVDIVRNLPFIGPDKMAVVQELAFRFRDVVRRQVGTEDTVTISGVSQTAALPASYREGLGIMPGEEARRSVLPPPPIEPFRDDLLPGETEWFPVVETVTPAPDGLPVFFQSFVRVDPERDYAAVHVTAWDPSRVQLGIAAGLEEPQPRTSAVGTGLIPRDVVDIEDLVGGFNGGFQSVHGTFGMIEQGTVLVRPQEGAATVATFADGRTAFGRWDEDWEIPAALVGLRQNLAPLVADGAVNPDRQSRWGWALGQNSQNRSASPLTLRSGLCRIESGALAYFMGTDIDGETLGAAMLHTGCTFGIHLDMNPGHTGFEYYEVYGPGRRDFNTRLLLPEHHLARHPRYIRQSARDFFYLWLRPQPDRLGLSDACRAGEVVPFERLTADGQPLSPEEAILLAPPEVLGLVDHPLCDAPDAATTVIRFPADSLRAAVTYYREPPTPEELARDRLPIVIPVASVEASTFLTTAEGPDGEPRIAFGGAPGAGVPAEPIGPGVRPPFGRRGSVVGRDATGAQYLLFATTPAALAATVERLALTEGYWLPAADTGAMAEVHFDDGSYRGFPLAGERANISEFVLWLSYVAPPYEPNMVFDLAELAPAEESAPPTP